MTAVPDSVGQLGGRQERFADTLKHLIEVRGYARRRKEVARSIHVSNSALSQYVASRSRPSFDILISLAEFFGVSLDYLVFGEGALGPSVVDHGPLARAIDHSLNRAQALTSRQIAFTSRIAQLLVEQIATSARELAEHGAAAPFSGQMDDDQTLLVEGFALKTRLLSMDLTYDVLESGEAGAEAAGRFMQVVASNLSNGRSVQIMIPGRQGDEAVVRLAEAERRLLTGLCSADLVHKHLEIRASSAPLFSGVCVYDLDTDSLRSEIPMLWELLADWVSPEQQLGYVIAPSRSVLADTLLDSSHLARAVESFDALWKRATHV